jgi:hypothetical protein
VQELVNGQRQPGKYNVLFDGEALPSGIYIVRMQSSVNTLASKIVLVK